MLAKFVLEFPLGVELKVAIFYANFGLDS